MAEITRASLRSYSSEPGRHPSLQGSSHADTHALLREVMLGELSRGRYLLDDVDHDAARSPADKVALSGGQVLKRLEYLHSLRPKPLVLALYARHLEVEKQCAVDRRKPSGIVSWSAEMIASS